MKIVLLQVGKTTENYLSDGINVYLRRLVHYADFSVQTLPELRNAASLSAEEQKRRDSDTIINAIQPGDDVVLLDERGHSFSSPEFATFLQKRMSASPRRLVFIIGGPYGFSDKLYQRASSLLSLSPMTFSHQMVRLFFVEQIYRAFTILRGERYHH